MSIDWQLYFSTSLSLEGNSGRLTREMRSSVGRDGRRCEHGTVRSVLSGPVGGWRLMLRSSLAVLVEGY